MNEPTEAVVVSSQSNAVTRISDNAMGVADILAQVKLIQNVMKEVMHEGEHFGTIPGCGNKQTLLQPGAQKLTMTFRLAPEYQIQETNFPNGHKEYRVICTLKSIANGNFVGQGVGCCSTLESKYRWRAGARKCPECGKETIIKGRKEYGGGWLCFAKKGGCGAKWADDSDGGQAFESMDMSKVEHDSPADFYNTVLKMAKKRAFVDATITATAASDIFTQDVGDLEGEEAPEQPPKTPQDAPRKPKRQAPVQSAAAPAAPKSATASAVIGKDDEKGWHQYLGSCKERLLQLVTADDEWAWWRYAVDHDWILPSGESLLDARREKMFEGYDRKNSKESIKAIFEKHTAQVKAQAASCSVELHDEIQRGMTPMVAPKKAAAASAPAPATTPAPNTCPACKSTAIKTHDDLVGVSWCQKCGTQWHADNRGEDYEEHEWMLAELPFAPKDPEKKDYQGMTLGQLSRIDNKYWFGIVKNFKAEPFRGRPPSKEAVEFAAACDAARKHLEEAKRAEPAEHRGNEPSAFDTPHPEDDDVPF